jgi:hypothetical protein
MIVKNPTAPKRITASRQEGPVKSDFPWKPLISKRRRQNMISQPA